MMPRSVLTALLLAGLGLAATGFLLSLRSATSPPLPDSGLASFRPTPSRGFGAVRVRPKPPRPRINLERKAPVPRRAAELPERRPPQRERPGASVEEPAVHRSASDNESEPTGPDPAPPHDEPMGDNQGAKNPGVIIDYSKSALERALTDAGLPPAAAAEVKRRYDELAMDEISLRNQATREGWIHTPEFTAELDQIETERLAIRDEIGDDAYDHYLFALGQPNRVYVTDAMVNSPAAIAGLQTSDVIVRYGGARILTPSDLIAETQVGTPGETIRVDITRNGKPLTLEVPRGPLGLRIGVTQEPPEKLNR